MTSYEQAPYEGGAKVSAVFWITSLKDSELGPTRRVLEDIEPFLSAEGWPFKHIQANSAADLLAALQEVLRYARRGGLPLIHFDMHGSQRDGLCIAGSSESVPWMEVSEQLRHVNVATHNNLIVVSSVCFGLHLIEPLAIHEPTPFYALVAPPAVVKVGFEIENLPGFYRALFTVGDLSTAYRDHLSNEMSLFLSEQMLAVALAGYFRDACRGRGLRERRERLISEARAQGVPLELKAARKLINTMAKPSQAVVDRYVKSFLLGKPVQFTANSLLRDLDRKRRRY